MLWHPLFSFTAGEAVAVTATTQPGGGIYYQGGRKRKHVKRITENVREWIDGVYADLTAPSAPPANSFAMAASANCRRF